MNKVIGIDLGTTNSCVSVFENGKATVIANSEGKRTTPSIISFGKDGEKKVGDAAKRQAVVNPTGTVYEVKRFMGNKFSDVAKEIKRVTYKVVDNNGQPAVSISDKLYTPQELSAMVLQKMKKTAEDYIGEEVKDAVITVPAYFNDAQRQATKEAGEIAGLNVMRIISEPTASAISYGVDKSDKDMNVIVFDFGGGTHDVSVLNFGGGVFEVLATNGDTHLGGSDIDEIVSEWLVNEFKSESGIDLSKDSIAMQRIKEAAEKAKIELSSSNSTEINLPYITATEEGPKHLIKTLSKAKFESLISDIVKRTIEPCKKALNAAKLTVNDISEILLVGGSSRIPCIQDAIKNFFGKEPCKGVNPDEAVSLGAAIQGAILNKESGVDDIVLLDVTPLSLGIEAHGDVFAKMIDANTTIPTKKSQVCSTVYDNQTEVCINVLQGERMTASGNKSLGKFILDGIVPAQKGVPQIEVTFDIDSNGIVSVSAKDLGTNKEQSIRIEASSNLSKEDIERMKAEAKEYEEQDKKHIDEQNTLNDSERCVNTYDDLMKTIGDKVSAEDKEMLDNNINELKKANESKDIDKIKELMAGVEEKIHAIAQKVYSESKAETPTEEKPNNKADDAEYTDFEECK